MAKEAAGSRGAKEADMPISSIWDKPAFFVGPKGRTQSIRVAIRDIQEEKRRDSLKAKERFTWLGREDVDEPYASAFTTGEGTSRKTSGKVQICIGGQRQVPKMWGS